MQLGKINDRWELWLPDFRCEFHAVRPTWEKGRLDSCAGLMTPGMTIVDVGAEHGDFTALYKQWVGESGDVIPVEPAKHYWPFIRETFAANNMTNPTRCFEGFAAERSAWESHGLWPAWPLSAYGEGIPDGGFLHLAHAPRVPRISLDDLIGGGPVGGIVIDVEGAEFEVLAGATQLCTGPRPHFWVSVHEPTMWNWYQRELSAIHQLMAEWDYVGVELPHHGEGETFWLYSPK